MKDLIQGEVASLLREALTVAKTNVTLPTSQPCVPTLGLWRFLAARLADDRPPASRSRYILTTSFLMEVHLTPYGATRLSLVPVQETKRDIRPTPAFWTLDAFSGLVLGFLYSWAKNNGPEPKRRNWRRNRSGWWYWVRDKVDWLYIAANVLAARPDAASGGSNVGAGIEPTSPSGFSLPTASVPF